MWSPEGQTLQGPGVLPPLKEGESQREVVGSAEECAGGSARHDQADDARRTCEDGPMSMNLFDDHDAIEVRDEDHFVPSFDDWYDGYPKKTGKADARKRWAKMSAPEKAAAWNSNVGWARYAAEHPQGNQFVPMASTFLNGKRWEDEPPTAPTPERRQAPGLGILRERMQRAQDERAIEQ